MVISATVISPIWDTKTDRKLSRDAETDTKPRISIKGYDVIVEHCTDPAEARALVEQRISDIQKWLAEMKTEKTVFNRHKHILSRWLSKQKTDR